MMKKQIGYSLGASLYFVYPFAAMGVALISSVKRLSAESVSLRPISSVLLSTTYRGIAISATVALLAVTFAAISLLHLKIGRHIPVVRMGARAFAVSTQFFSPLLVAMGWIVTVGHSRIAFSLPAMILGLLSLALPPAYIVLDLYVVGRLTRYIEMASVLGARPLMRSRLALALARPAIIGSLLITFAWTYCDLVVISLVGSGNQFYPGPLVSYLIRQSTIRELALFATLPSVALALGAAIVSQPSGKRS
ncbi:MAG TPA: hypothetical protein VKZ53_22930 [Candidatus Angelobacter sp.]|nr:hypothetical protein [Candidatus Angelobacter sp.]